MFDIISTTGTFAAEHPDVVMLATVALISILGVSVDLVMRMAEKRLIPWRG